MWHCGKSLVLLLVAFILPSAQATSLIQALQGAGASQFAALIQSDANASALYFSNRVQTVFAPADGASNASITKLRRRQSSSTALQSALYQSTANTNSLASISSGSGLAMESNDQSTQLGGKSQVFVSNPSNMTGCSSAKRRDLDWPWHHWHTVTLPTTVFMMVTTTELITVVSTVHDISLTTVITTDFTVVTTTDVSVVNDTELVTVPTTDFVTVPTTVVTTIQNTKLVTVLTTIVTTIQDTKLVTVPTTDLTTVPTTDITTMQDTHLVTAVTTDATTVHDTEFVTELVTIPTTLLTTVLTAVPTTFLTTVLTTVPTTVLTAVPTTVVTTLLSTVPTTAQNTELVTLTTTFLTTLINIVPITFITTVPITLLTTQLITVPTTIPTTISTKVYTTVSASVVPSSLPCPVKISSGLGNAVNILRADIPYDGGLIHIIDDYFTLPETLTNTANANGETAFTGLASSYSLTDTLDNTPEITCFIPNNDAFAMPGSTSNYSSIKSLLLGHVIPNFVGYLPSLTNGTTYTSQGGSNFTVTVNDGDYYINNAKIILANVIVENGVAHVIDQVIQPSVNSTALPGSSSSTGSSLRSASLQKSFTAVWSAILLLAAVIFI